MKLNHILITTGSAEGIGSEITAKALNSLKPSKNTRYSILTTKRSQNILLKKPWKQIQGRRSELNDWRNRQANQVHVWEYSRSADYLVRKAVQFCLADSDSALATAPMRKSDTGAGHTEIIKELTGSNSLKMAFMGKKFSLCLGTIHIPIDQVYRKITSSLVSDTMKAANRLHSLTGSTSHDPIAVLGLNPHAGEGGSISAQDGRIQELMDSAKVNGPFSELLPADGAFAQGSPARTVIAWYHDQGLIPFKLMHGLSQGIQVTLGIPFIRTSVDHGTAENLFGKGIADFRSMKMAIEMARKLQLKHGNTEY